MNGPRPANLARSALLVTSAALLAAAVGPAAWAAEPARIANVPAAADGRIAFNQHRQIVTINPDGTGTRLLTEAGHNSAPVWSPDGSTIAYVHRTAGRSDLWIMSADGSGKTAVTSTGHVSRSGASWSPDGTQLAFGGPCILTRDPGVCDNVGPDDFAMDIVSAVAPYGSPVTELGDLPGYPDQALRVLDRVAWSPTGADIAYASDSYGTYPGDEYILVLHRTTGEVAYELAVGMGGTYGHLGNPSFSPDGLQLGYDAFVEGQPEIINKGIEVCGYPTGPCDAFREVLDDSSITFAPAQDRVAFVRDLDRDRVVVADANGRHRTKLAYGGQPSWQPIPTA